MVVPEAKEKPKKVKGEARKKKPNPTMELEGNQKLNTIKKKEFKKQKKDAKRREKVALQLSAGLEGFSLSPKKDKPSESYNFDTDFVMK